MKIIDAHHHAWKYNPIQYGWIDESMSVLKKDFLLQEIHKVFAKNGVEGSVLVQAVESTEETDFLLRLADQSDMIKGVVGWVDLQSEDVVGKLQEYVGRAKLKGFRHVVQKEPDPSFMLNDNFQRGIDALQQFDFTYDILIFPNQLPAAIQLAKNFPNQSFVLDHIAKPYINDGKISEWAKNLRLLAENENVHCKISGIVTEANWENWTYDQIAPYLDVVLEAFGIDRLMYGSDYPVCLLAAPYDTVIGIVKKYFTSFPPVDQQKVFGGNAMRFYKLS